MEHLPQYILTAYLTWLCGVQILHISNYPLEPAVKYGRYLGYILRYGIIFSLLIAGGFYN